MKTAQLSKVKYFYIIGISYKKADAAIRGKFSLNQEAKDNLLKQAKAEDFEGLMTISTCNRTELYGFAEHPYQLIKLLCEFTNGSVEDFQAVGYIFKNHDAISHFFNVATGLDSQILGDFEIIGQIKKAFIEARVAGLSNPYLERMTNVAIQASKRIKSETGISSGATSVAFASVKYLLTNVDDISDKNILLYGTGKIGRNTCENLVKHTQNKSITLINRTADKAQHLAGKFNLIVKEIDALKNEIDSTDILIVATGSDQPTIDATHVSDDKKLLILDLSIPKNVSAQVYELPNVQVIHLDELSRMTDETIEMRESFVPDARAIIADVQGDFEEWLENRKFAPTIKALKKKLEIIKNEEIDNQSKKISGFDEAQAEVISSRIIQKITTLFANHLKSNPQQFDDNIELIKDIFDLSETNKHEKSH
ncbi:MAG: glutamyl-tRNA reductase [Flavobacteriales bacterium CG_4_9_14_3_um_filter_40_17]|nr:MAG: glutamyl-tRNA reductase [Flavobacteriales bacterium CG_4_9_14_3_um_filter_40_17]